jgi:hypothetical protein
MLQETARWRFGDLLVMSEYRPPRIQTPVERQVSIQKKTRDRISCLADMSLSVWTDEIQGRSGD